MNITLLEYALRLLYPEYCESCSCRLSIKERYVCSACNESISKLYLNFWDSLSSERFEFLDFAWTLAIYSEPITGIIHKIKYSRKRHLLKIFSRPLSDLLEKIKVLRHYDKILPIPIERFKRVSRHFNQTEELSQMLRRKTLLRVAKNVLIKTAHTPNQASLTKEERAINIYGAFAVKNSAKIKGQNILLIDDVLTTGATTNEAARVLKESGAKTVDLLTIARTEAPQNKNKLRLSKEMDKIQAL